MYIDKGVLVSRIKNAAQTYSQYLVGKTYMFVYGDKLIEVIFKTESFLHLTGVSSTLYPKDFYKKAKRKQLKQSEIGFDSKHPADFADIKTQQLDKLYELTIKDILLVDNVITMTATFAVGLTNLSIVLCCGKNTDKNGNVINDCYVPYSFRVEEIDNGKFGDIFEVDYVFCKPTTQNKYSEMAYGNADNLKNLSEEIKQKLDEDILKED